MNTKESFVAFTWIMSLTCKTIFSLRTKLSRALLIPLIFIVFLADASYQINFASIDDKWWEGFLKLLFELIFTGIMAIVVHRIILLGEHSVPDWGILHWSIRETRFVLSYIGVYAVFGAMLFFLFAIKIGTFHIGFIGAFIFGFYLLSRWSLIFPGIAVDRPLTLAESWNLTENYKLLVGLTVILLPLAFTALSILLYIPIVMYVNNGLIQAVLIDLIKAGYMVFQFAILTFTYRYIVDQQQPIIQPVKIPYQNSANRAGVMYIPLLLIALAAYMIGINSINGRLNNPFKAAPVLGKLYIKDEIDRAAAEKLAVKATVDPQIDGNIEVFQKYLTDAQEKGYANMAAVYHQSLGSLYAEKADHVKAFEHFNNALTYFEQHGHQAAIAGTYASVADFYGKSGQFDKMQDYYDKSIEIYETLNDHVNIANSYFRIAFHYESKRDSAKAINYTQQALAIHQNLGDRAAMSDDFIKLGRLLSTDENWDAALGYYQKAFTLKEKLQEISVAVSIQDEIGQLYERLGKSDLARLAFKRRDSLKQTQTQY